MAKKRNEAIEVVEIKVAQFDVCLLGRSPLYLNAMSAKVKQGLLLPGKRKTRIERETTLKHDPIGEFRSSVYRTDGDGETRLMFPAAAFKRALASAAIDMPGAAKAQIGRLAWAEGRYVPLYGVPQLDMKIVRSADIARTPDVRTRALLPTWACRVRFRYVRPNLTEHVLANLLYAAGLIRGVGDGRIEKGWGDFGQFEIVPPDDDKFLAVVNAGGRAAQDAALQDPQCSDEETAELLAWFVEERERRTK